jgi:hypothetical protein
MLPCCHKASILIFAIYNMIISHTPSTILNTRATVTLRPSMVARKRQDSTSTLHPCLHLATQSSRVSRMNLADLIVACILRFVSYFSAFQLTSHLSLLFSPWFRNNWFAYSNAVLLRRLSDQARKSPPSLRDLPATDRSLRNTRYKHKCVRWQLKPGTWVGKQ